MRKIKPVFLIVFLYIIGSTGFVLGQTDDPPVIENKNQEAVQYCSDPVAVAPSISIQNIQIDEEGEGMKISISPPYKQGEDILEWDEVGTFNYTWNANSGYLEISGIGTDSEYELAVSKVYYHNVSATPSSGVRSFSISLKDADYLPATNHFYRFVAHESITWTNARLQAASMDYYGLQGYLATIRSQEEQDFIFTKTEGTGWIGANDADVEGTWKWVEGPDDGVVFWSGNFDGSPVNGEYSHWGSGEPNNLNNEDYAHILYNVGIRGYWNDLPNQGTGGDYTPQGFLIEYGGMKGDPELKLSAIAYVDVLGSEKPKFDETKVQNLFCGGTTHELTLAFTNGNPTVKLVALDPEVTVVDEASYNPTITVPSYGIYSFQLEMVDDEGCDYVDTLEIGIHNQPEATFNLDSNECYGYNLQLEFTGTTVEEAEFTWYYNSEEFTTGTDLDNVIIPLGFENIERTVALKVNEQGCKATSLPKEVKVKPNILVSAENTEGCSPLPVDFTAKTSIPAQSYLWDFADGTSSSEQDPAHKFINPDDVLLPFDISLTVLDDKGCENTAVYDSLVRVYPVPRAGFDFEPEEVLITDPEITFTNTSHAATGYFWDFGDSTFTDEKDPMHRYDAMNIYMTSLEVTNDFACADTIQKNVTVTFDRLFPPNAFSPNATLEEDREFRIYGDGVLDEGYQLLIFNRWGEMIFESNSQNLGWDGKMKNDELAPAGVYTWVIQYTDFTGEKHKQQGTLTLLI
ncbi:PKD domain-containing protein [Maribellus sediminis]|uniref:PKD domain-containing protein n=1 Tax=Maribellus sediminis TaxID=2696285 RepID=UPI001431386D|nr:PKD domain-containing protein [Maribellus sediminis]